MLRLLYNDIRLNVVWFFWVFLLLNLDLSLRASMNLYFNPYSGIKVAFSYVMVLPLVLFLREEYWKTRVVDRSLPVSASRFVITRYLSVCLLGLLPVLYGWLYQGFIEILGPHSLIPYRLQHMEAGYGLEHSLIARSLGFSIALAIAMPLVIRFGSVWKILIGFVCLRIVWSRIIDYLLGYSLHTTFFLGWSRWVFFASVFIIAILSISARLSVWLYEQRDL
jgi:hypothetical protein